MNHIVGIGGIAIAVDEKDCIITHALGSCVAVTFYDNITKVAAMIHIALPSQN